jgi:prolyl oligopeptidase PreP (S9A serine peptidase family)
LLFRVFLRSLMRCPLLYLVLQFTIGHAWITDYGDPDAAEDFAW